ncbi:MAG: TRAP transporter substrate-binding protein [Trueperaceae bacterium]
MTKLFLALIPVLLAASAFSQEVTLRLHHFLAPNSPTQQGYLEPWAERVEQASDGRIEVEIYPSMQLGGAAPSLIDQVEDGVVDLVWTLPGYTAGRFPISEAFELPFMSGLAVHSSQALCEFFEMHLQDEYESVRVITLHTAGHGILHVKGRAVTSLEDLRGLQIRAPNRITAEALAALGAQPIGMPVPQVPESLVHGVIDGTLLPWEVTVPLRIAELVDSHTTFDSPHGFYSSIFLLAMNRQSYERLPDDLKPAIDANSMAAGCDEARIAGASVDAADLVGEALAREQGNAVHVIPRDRVKEWQDGVRPVIDSWVEMMDRAGLDGEVILQDARDLVAKYEGAAAN